MSVPTTLDSVDLSNLEPFSRDDAWRQFDVLRAQSPVHWNPELGSGTGFWSVTRHQDIIAVDRDSETYTSTEYVNMEDVDDDLKDLRRSMLESDGVRHRALRKLMQREFGGQTLRKYEDFLQGLTRVTVDAALRPTGAEFVEFDFVEQISADFPVQVLARMLGVPAADTGKLIDWGNRMIGNTDPDYADVLLGDADSDKYKHLPFRSPAALEVFEYGRELARQRLGGDGEDLISKLINRVPADSEPLTAREFDNYFLLLVVAGNETTRHTISHSMLALINNPDQLSLLQRRPELIPTAVEELLRWASPVYHFRRTATRDVELAGASIKKGDKVVMWFASGNRDESVFTNPYALDVTRNPNDHVTFGKSGPHFCLGNNLARMEIRLMLETLLPRIRRIELAGDVTYVRSNFVHGIKKFPVRVWT